MKFSIGVSLKLIIAVGISTIIIISILAVVINKDQKKSLISEIEQNTSQLSETIKNSTKYDMLLNKRQDLHQIINTIGAQPGILDVRVFNKDGRVIYSPNPEMKGIMVDKKAEACFTCHASKQPLSKLSISDRTRIFHTDKGRVMGSINPIYNEISCYTADCHAHSKDQTVLGVLDITVSLNSLDQKLALNKKRMFIFALFATLAISFVVGYFVHIWINRPVRKLLEATKKVGSGNMSHFVTIHSEDELGLLARSFNDMTQKLADARQQLFQSDKMASLGQLAAGVAHEINNPLTGILTYSSFLLKRMEDQPEIKKDLAVIVRETKRSRDIVKGLLDFSRQTVPQKKSHNINAVIDRAIPVIENQLNINDIELRRESDSNLPDVQIDCNQIQQVFVNLIINSIHAIGTQEGGLIDINIGKISLKPYGVTHVHAAQCLKGHNLLDPSIKIHGKDSIRLMVKLNGKEGFVNLDPIYGKNENIYGIQIKPMSKVKFMCTKCKDSLILKSKICPKCSGPVYFFEVPGKGTFEGCAVMGCDWQYWQNIEDEGSRDFIEIKVSDNGCGIPPKNIPKIFDPFYTTKDQQGTGLGLSVIWGIIDSHKGNISVKSAIDKGTVFSILLPADNITHGVIV